MAKDNFEAKTKLIEGINVINDYLELVEKQSRKEGVLRPGIEADLAEKSQWLTDERLRIEGMTDRNVLKTESQKLKKFWLELGLRLRALQLSIVEKDIEKELERLRRLQVKMGLEKKVSLVNKLAIAQDKLEIVKVSLNSLILGGGSEDDWKRDKQLLREAIQYERYALKEMKGILEK